MVETHRGEREGVGPAHRARLLSSHFQGHGIVPHAEEFILREVLNLSWGWGNAALQRPRTGLYEPAQAATAKYHCQGSFNNGNVFSHGLGG